MKQLILSITTLLSLGVSAQKKEFTEQQMLRGGSNNITTQLPRVLGWVDDVSLLINKKEHQDSVMKVFLVDCKTGKMTPSSADLLKKETGPMVTVSLRDNDVFVAIPGQPTKQLTKTPETEVNPTLSPDKAWVAFTRKNDLYTINIASGKEYRITKDGTDLILNGYASWSVF